MKFSSFCLFSLSYTNDISVNLLPLILNHNIILSIDFLQPFYIYLYIFFPDMFYFLSSVFFDIFNSLGRSLWIIFY
jgi:hypothetical protein